MISIFLVTQDAKSLPISSFKNRVGMIFKSSYCKNTDQSFIIDSSFQTNLPVCLGFMSPVLFNFPNDWTGKKDCLEVKKTILPRTQVEAC